MEKLCATPFNKLLTFLLYNNTMPHSTGQPLQYQYCRILNQSTMLNKSCSYKDLETRQKLQYWELWTTPVSSTHVYLVTTKGILGNKSSVLRIPRKKQE